MMRRVGVWAAALVLAGAVGGCVPGGGHHALSEYEFGPLRGLVAAADPGAHVEFTRTTCGAEAVDGEADATAEQAVSRTPVAGDATEVGRRVYEAGLALGWTPYAVAGSATAYFTYLWAPRYRILVEGTPQGTVVSTSVTRDECVDDAPGLGSPGQVTDVLITPAQRAALASVTEASTPVLAAIEAWLPERAGGPGSSGAVELPGGLLQDTSTCGQGTPQVGRAPLVEVPAGHVAPPITADDITRTIASIVEPQGWTYAADSIPRQVRWTKSIPGQAMTLEASYRGFSTLDSIYVTVSVTSGCTPYTQV
ncbi:hypothetical protein OG216_45135 [Streptomycetaceae bacterium NBC_01309]